MSIEPEDVSTFLAVVRECSFGRAASTMLVSQPTVSDRVARLECVLGSRLFTRGPRGVVLTGAGERFAPYAVRLTELGAEAIGAVRSIDQPPPFRVGVHATFTHQVVPLVLGALGDTSRNVRIRDAHSDQIIAMLLDGVLDVGFVLPGARPAGLRFARLPADPVVGVCSPDHELRGARSVSMSTLARQRLALNLWGSGAQAFMDSLLGADTVVAASVECSDVASALRLARDHGYVALVAQSAAGRHLDRGTLRPVAIRPHLDWTINLVLATRWASDSDPAVEAVARTVRDLGPGRSGSL